jgi:hypothetical protein
MTSPAGQLNLSLDPIKPCSDIYSADARCISRACCFVS